MALFGLARMTVSSSGTGNITLNSAVASFLTFDLAGCSTASTGQAVSYAIADTTQSELGRSIYYSSGPTLTRGSSASIKTLQSTNTNSPIAMSNAAQVFITPAATDFPFVVDPTGTSATTSFPITFTAALTYGGVTLSNAVTGTGNMVLSASPTLTGTLTAAILSMSGALTYGGVTLTAAVTGTGSMVLSASPTFTGTVTIPTLVLTTVGAHTISGAITYGGVALSNAVTGTGNMVLSAAPTLTGTTTIATLALTTVGAHTISGAITYGGVTLSNSVTGTGSMVLSASPALTGTVSASAISMSNALTYGGVTLSNAVTGTGSMVLSASPTLTGTLTVDTVVVNSTITAQAIAVTGASAGNIGLYAASSDIGVVGSQNAKIQMSASGAIGRASAFNFLVNMTSNGICLQANGLSGTIGMLDFCNFSLTQCGSITSDTGALTTFYATSSDARGKPHRAPLSGVRAALDALEPLDFTDEGNHIRTIGFVAQDAYAVVPHVVQKGDEVVEGWEPTNPNWQMWQIDNSKLVPYLVADAKDTHQRLSAIESHLGL